MLAGTQGARDSASFAVLICLSLFFTGASAQEHNLKHYGTGDGLPQTQVLVIRQDATGYLWLGTYGGLGRYNGREFEVFSTAEGLAANMVEALASAPDGHIWAGTASGLCYLKPDAAHFQCLEDTVLAGMHVQALLPGPDGLWVGTDSGFFRVTDGDVARFGHDTGLSDANVRSLARGADGELWVGTTTGLLRSLRPGLPFETVPMPTQAGRQVLALLREGGRLWIGTDSGLYVRENDSIGIAPGLPAAWPHDDVNSLALGSDGVLWAATNLGVLRRDPGGFRLLTTYEGLISDINFAVYADREGLIWLGNDNGLSKYIPGPFTGYTGKHGLLHSFVRTINEDAQGRLWLGTREGAQIVPYTDGEWRIADSRTITAADGLVDERIYSIAFPAPGEALLATGDGVAHWNEGVGIVRIYTEQDGLPTNSTQALKLGPDGRVWIGTNLGVALLQDGAIKPAPDPVLAQAYVYRIREDTRGRLWFGSQDHGLFVIMPSGEITRLQAAQGLTNETIWDLAPDTRGGMWIGSNGDGLFYIGPDGEIHQYTTTDGLVDNFVWQVFVDDRGHVWSYTNRGLSRFDGATFRNYDAEDGLLHVEGGATGAWQTHDGQLWFASADGLMKYDPAGEYKNEMPPVVIIEQATTNGRSIAPGSELPYRSGSLDFDYAALSFHSEPDLRYRYRLLGAREEWSDPMPYRPITFGNLGAGEYVFEVQARNPDGVWSTEPARFSLQVLPPFWASFWFWSLLVPGVGALAWGGFRVRIRQMEARRHELEEIVRERTRELETANEKLQTVSITDPLTGLLNRRFLVSQIGTDVAQSRRAYRGPSIFPNRDIIFMMIDLDHFKDINDTYGHSAGDRVLRQYAQLIAGHIRESDYVVRWGGEEFLVVARQAESTQCNVVADRIMQRAREVEFEMDDAGTKVRCNCSIGVSHFPFLRHDPDTFNWEQIVDIADVAVYLAKSSGRDGWIAIQGTDKARVDDSMAFMHRIKEDMAGLVAEGQILLTSSFDNPLKKAQERHQARKKD